jgi:hypothetical protein
MASVTETGQAIKGVLGVIGDKVARETGFTKRESKLTGAKFAQATVLGWLHKPEATLAELSQIAASVGVAISPQGLDERFTPAAAELLHQVLNGALTQIISAQPVAIPILQRFSAVILQDSSTIVLPDVLAAVWKGCGGTDDHNVAALKLQVRLDITNGTLYGPVIEDGRAQDRGSSTQSAPLPAKALRIADLGFFSLDRMAQCDLEGSYYLSRLQVQTAVYGDTGHRLDLLRVLHEAGPGLIDLSVQLGWRHRLKARLIVIGVPQEVADQRRHRLREDARRRGQNVSQMALMLADWTILVTNAPPELLSASESLVMLRVRWQIELLFRLWKQHGLVDEWRTRNPWRILVETYAKLTGLVIQHWLFLVSFWPQANRSLVKGAQTVRSHATMLAAAIRGAITMDVAIAQITTCLSAGCRMNPRRKEPNTYQLLLGLTNDS